MTQWRLEARLVRSRRLLWAALISPFVYTLSRTATEVQNASLGPLDLLRGGGPLLLLGLSMLTAKPVRRLDKLTWAGALIFCAVALASTFWSVDPRVTALKAVALAASYAGLLRLASSYRTSEAALKGLITFVYVMLLAVAAQFVVIPGAVYAPDSVTGSRRLSAIAPAISANPLAYLTLAGIAAILLKLGPAWAVRRPEVRVVLLGLFIAELIATRTRSALVVGLILVLASGFLLFLRRPVIVTQTVLAAAVAALLAYGNGTAVSEYLARGQSDQSLLSLSGRTTFWRIGLDAWQERPWGGLGYFAGHRLGLQGLPGGGQQSNLDHTWIETLVDVGLLGTFGLALFVLVGATHVLRWRTSDYRLKAWAVAVVAAGVSISFLNPTVQTPGSNAVLLGFALAAVAPGRANPPDTMIQIPTPRRLRRRGGVSVAARKRPAGSTARLLRQSVSHAPPLLHASHAK